MITTEQFKLFDDLYSFYNKELFGGLLNDCMITTSRKKKAYGFFVRNTWQKNKSKDVPEIHEISLNPDFLNRIDEAWQATLVHEMVHLWQQDFGETSRAGYHNKEWAKKMKEIGLYPSSTGEEGGKETGQSCSHYIIPGGAFIEAFNRLKEKQIKYITIAIPIGSEKSKTAAASARSKTKYTCACKNNVWGKPDLLIVCAVCNQRFIEITE